MFFIIRWHFFSTYKKYCIKVRKSINKVKWDEIVFCGVCAALQISRECQTEMCFTTSCETVLVCSYNGYVICGANAKHVFVVVALCLCRSSHKYSLSWFAASTICSTQVFYFYIFFWRISILSHVIHAKSVCVCMSFFHPLQMLSSYSLRLLLLLNAFLHAVVAWHLFYLLIFTPPKVVLSSLFRYSVLLLVRKFSVFR